MQAFKASNINSSYQLKIKSNSNKQINTPTANYQQIDQANLHLQQYLAFGNISDIKLGNSLQVQPLNRQHHLEIDNHVSNRNYKLQQLHETIQIKSQQQLIANKISERYRLQLHCYANNIKQNYRQLQIKSEILQLSNKQEQQIIKHQMIKSRCLLEQNQQVLSHIEQQNLHSCCLQIKSHKIFVIS